MVSFKTHLDTFTIDKYTHDRGGGLVSIYLLCKKTSLQNTIFQEEFCVVQFIFSIIVIVIHLKGSFNLNQTHLLHKPIHYV